MFSIRATRRSGDGTRDRRNDHTERVHLLTVESSSGLFPGGYYADLGFRPPAD